VKEFFERLNALGKPKRPDIIEKDFHLHRLLGAVSKDTYLRGNLVFKGGTCLIKAHMSYYRFSEDIDFTWRDASIWEDRSLSETKRRCSKELGEVVKRFKSISDELGFRFKGDKSVADEVHISSGGRMALLWLSYDSEIQGVPSKIKVEINFVDKILFPIEERELHSYVESFDSEELRFLYEKPWREYSAKVVFPCYDAREIFVEKCRATLTRKAYKLRDSLDIVYMGDKYGFTVSGFKPHILKKTCFMLETYERYRENLELPKGPLPEMKSADEMRLLLDEPAKDLADNVKNANAQLEAIRKEILAGK
jgi:predicted nucleotidyltransferase component of viral defense system